MSGGGSMSGGGGGSGSGIDAVSLGRIADLLPPDPDSQVLVLTQILVHAHRKTVRAYEQRIAELSQSESDAHARLKHLEVCCMLYVVCCMLYVVCCMLWMGWLLRCLSLTISCFVCSREFWRWRVKGMQRRRMHTPFGLTTSR